MYQVYNKYFLSILVIFLKPILITVIAPPCSVCVCVCVCVCVECYHASSPAWSPYCHICKAPCPAAESSVPGDGPCRPASALCCWHWFCPSWTGCPHISRSHHRQGPPGSLFLQREIQWTNIRAFTGHICAAFPSKHIVSIRGYFDSARCLIWHGLVQSCHFTASADQSYHFYSALVDRQPWWRLRLCRVSGPHLLHSETPLVQRSKM